MFCHTVLKNRVDFYLLLHLSVSICNKSVTLMRALSRCELLRDIAVAVNPARRRILYPRLGLSFSHGLHLQLQLYTPRSVGHARACRDAGALFRGRVSLMSPASCACNITTDITVAAISHCVASFTFFPVLHFAPKVVVATTWKQCAI